MCLRAALTVTLGREWPRGCGDRIDGGVACAFPSRDNRIARPVLPKAAGGGTPLQLWPERRPRASHSLTAAYSYSESSENDRRTSSIAFFSDKASTTRERHCATCLRVFMHHSAVEQCGRTVAFCSGFALWGFVAHAMQSSSVPQQRRY